jgi:hypothetical protein
MVDIQSSATSVNRLARRINERGQSRDMVGLRRRSDGTIRSVATSIRMTPTQSALQTDTGLTAELARMLGARRTARLRRVMRHTRLPPEALLDLAIELLDIASRKLSPAPFRRTAVGLAAARWRNVGPEERSKALRKAAMARWAKPRPGRRTDRGHHRR